MRSFIVPQKLNTFFKSFILFFFHRNKYQDSYNSLEFFFKKIFPSSEIYLTGAGRVSIYYSLLSFKSIFPNKNEVIVTGFTCASVIDSILRADLKPVYVEISTKTFGTDPVSISKKITKNTLAIIAQHTFGFPCEIQEIKNNIGIKDIFLIEDCAISFNSKIKNKLIGSFGDISIFSFDHSKPINLLMGGVIVCNNPILLKFLEKKFIHTKKPNTSYEISLIFYMLFDILTYKFENKNIQQFVRVIYAIIKRLKLIGNPIIKKYFNKKITFNNYNRISHISLIIFQLEKSRIENILVKRKLNFMLINSFINKNLNIVKPETNLDNQISPLRIILFFKNQDKIKLFLEKYFDSRFFWFKEPIIARERDFEFYKFNNDLSENSQFFFNGVINISLNLSFNKNKMFLQKFQKIIDSNYE